MTNEQQAAPPPPAPPPPPDPQHAPEQGQEAAPPPAPAPPPVLGRGWLRALLYGIRQTGVPPRDPRVRGLWRLLRRRQLLEQNTWIKATLRHIWEKGLGQRYRPRTTRRMVAQLRAWGVLRPRQVAAPYASTVIRTPVAMRPLRRLRPVILRRVATARPLSMRPVQVRRPFQPMRAPQVMRPMAAMRRPLGVRPVRPVQMRPVQVRARGR